MKATSNKIQNKVSALLHVALAACAVISISQFAVAQLVLDDFSTGPYQKTLKSGADTNIQYGSMVGDSRETTLSRPAVAAFEPPAMIICPPGDIEGTITGPRCNPTPTIQTALRYSGGFNQSVSFEIRGKTKSVPAALVYSSGYKADGYLDVFYGKSTALTLDLASTYDRIRLNFDGAEFVNFNIVVYTNGRYSASGCNLADHTYGKPFSVDFPFTDFTQAKGTAGADFRNLTQIALLFANSEGPHGSEEFAVTSVQAIPTGAAAADVTCHGYGK
jgi:hypothetical protein